jgi:uncharacterized phiE125 gp8 family phage protein
MLIEEVDLNIKNAFVTTLIEPTTYPVTIQEIKDFGSIDGNDLDSFLEGILIGVVESIEQYLGRSLISRTLKLTFDNWPTKEIEFPKSPLLSIVSVNTVDEEGIETVYDSDNYYVVSENIPGKLVIKKNASLPVNNDRELAGFNIVYVAGYGNASKVPKTIKIAIMQWVVMIYENKSMSDDEVIKNEPPPSVKEILYPYRIRRI